MPPPKEILGLVVLAKVRDHCAMPRRRWVNSVLDSFDYRPDHAGLRDIFDDAIGVIPSDLGVTSPDWLGRMLNDAFPAVYAEIDDLRV